MQLCYLYFTIAHTPIKRLVYIFSLYACFSMLITVRYSINAFVDLISVFPFHSSCVMVNIHCKTLLLGMLIDQLTNSSYECMICCNIVRRDAAIWNCANCYHSFHLYCIKRWASSSSATATGGDVGENCWRCPACQNPTSGFPNAYMCFCG